MNNDITAEASIYLGAPAVPLHKIAAKHQNRYGLHRVSLVQLPKDVRFFWALPDTLPEGWDGWTLQATDMQALVVLPVSPVFRATPEPRSRWSWDAREYGRLVGKKAGARDGTHQLSLEGGAQADRGRWVSETAAGFLDGLRGDAEGEWPRVEELLREGMPGRPAKGPYRLNADLLARVQACVTLPALKAPSVDVHVNDPNTQIVVRGGRGFGLVMPVSVGQ